MQYEEQTTINDARTFFVAAGAILPLLEKKIARATEELFNDYKAGGDNLMAKVSELYAITALKRDIEVKSNLYEADINKINKRGEG